MRILVIEDDKDVASFIRNGLTQAGCNVDHAANGRDGLFLATTENYDALVVDRMLPGIDGLTVIRTLRASANTTCGRLMDTPTPASATHVNRRVIATPPPSSADVHSQAAD